jgi:hypothetical protein
LLLKENALKIPIVSMPVPIVALPPADILEAKLTQTEKVMREQTGGLVVRNTLNSSSWPCGDLLAVVFADPHDRSKVYRIWEKSKRET